MINKDETKAEATTGGVRLERQVRRVSKLEIEMLTLNLADNLNTKTWMDYFTKWDESDFVEATMGVDCHPERWDYACLCRECQSNA